MRPQRAKAYFSALRAELSSLAQFRANILAWLLYSPLQLGILYLLWSIVYRSADELGGLSFEDMIQYYLVVHLLRKVIEPAQTVNYQVWSEINQGNLDIYLARPLSYGLFTFFKSLGTPIMELLIGIPFLILLSLALGVALPAEPALTFAFISSVALGFTVLFLVQFLIGSLTFWFERIFGFRDIIFSLFMLFSGQLIPISLLPQGIERVSKFLPFESIYFIPATIFGLDQAAEAIPLLLVQSLWCGLLLAFAVAAWSRGVSRYASQGG